MRGMRKKANSPVGDISRRHFVAGGTGLLLNAGLLPWEAFGQAAQPSVRPVLHLIGHSHIDAAWLWPWTDSADLVLTTFRSALDRMRETPGLRYSHSSMVHYRWVQDADPKMFEEIRGRIREGRWEVVGGWPVEPDCNIPSTESFVRHCLYGKHFAKEALGVEVEIGFNPDSFGHAAGLPTILNKAGYKYYVFMRPQEHEMTLPRLFWWEGPDGSRVMTFHIYGSYDWDAGHLKAAAASTIPDGFHDGAFFLGVGDHGGAVTKRQIQDVLAMRSDSTLPELRWSTMREFFASVERSAAMKNLPVIRGDLQHHARGCYSACGEEKFQNRRAEHLLFTAESVAVAAASLSGRNYPASRFESAWEQVLFNQFHDILAGTSLFADYQQARDGIGGACEIALESKHLNLDALAKQVDLSDVEEGAIFAYNPLPWRRRALLEFHYASDKRMGPYTALRSKDGIRTALQERPSDSMTDFYPRLSAYVDLPPYGYTVFRIERETASAVASEPQSLQIAKGAFGLSSLRAEDGTELLRANMGLVVIEDKSDTWAHGVDAFRKELGRPTFVSAKIVEDGPVLRVTRQKARWRSSEITVDIVEFVGVDAIELRFVVNWQEHEQILKLELPTIFTSPSIHAKVPGAAIERAANGNEEPYQDWVSIQGSVHGQSYTLALLNNSTYSYDCLDGLLRTILVRSAPYARHNPNQVEIEGVNAWQDQGRQERTFWIVRGKGTYTDFHLDRRARELQTPADYVLDSRHTGTEPWEQSFLEIGPSSVEVLAVKQAEDKKSLVIRMQERAGKQTTTHLRVPSMKLDTEVSILPWEIKTLLIKHDGKSRAAVQVASLLEQ